MAVVVDLNGLQFVVIYFDSFMDDVSHGMWNSVCRVRFVRYQGAFSVALRLLDWDLCTMTVGLAGANPQLYSVAP